MRAAAVVVVGGILCAIVVLSAQQREYEPTCKMCPGTYIPNSEIQAYVKRAIANQLTDQQIRQVDIGKTNVGVAVVYRGKIDNPNANVAEHDLVSEVYHVIDGAATLVLGPDLVGKERRPANETTVRLLNGPGNNAKAIRNGVTYQLKAGDVGGHSRRDGTSVHEDRRSHHVPDDSRRSRQGDAAQDRGGFEGRSAHRRPRDGRWRRGRRVVTRAEVTARGKVKGQDAGSTYGHRYGSKGGRRYLCPLTFNFDLCFSASARRGSR